MSDGPQSKAQVGPIPPARVEKPRSSRDEKTVDDSGLFMKDTQPAPVEELLRASARTGTRMPSRTKRKFVEEDLPSADVEVRPFEGRPFKKLRVASNGSHKEGRDNVQEKTSAKEEQVPKAKTDDDEYYEDFVRAVQERLAVEDEKKRRKADKKRKRESGGSDSHQAQKAAHEMAAHEMAGMADWPGRKKAKTSSTTNTPEATSTAKSTPFQQSRQHTPQSDRSKKRASPAAEYLGGILSAAEKKRAKRLKT
jgi:hypothetical protein